MRKIECVFWDSKEKMMYGGSPYAINCHGEVSGLIYKNDSIEWEKTAYSEHIIPLQFTGINDKNNNRIYEGCIVRRTSTAQEELTSRD